MRRSFVAGNWKMNTSRAEAVALARGVAKACAATDGVDVAVCPPFVHLAAVAEALAGTGVALGAQNMYFEPKGAFTGEVSAAMLKDVGCRHVILGHSERRHRLGESDAVIEKKVEAALKAGLEIILCVGELIEERRGGKTSDVVRRQVESGLARVAADQTARLVIAYEPVWAIGTGENATPAQAQEVHALVRRLLAARFGESVSQTVRIQYGGSVTPDNARDLMGQPDVDGALVGGASLDADRFARIVQAAAAAKSR